LVAPPMYIAVAHSAARNWVSSNYPGDNLIMMMMVLFDLSHILPVIASA